MEDIKNKFRLTDEQIDRLKLLETEEPFQSAVKKFRNKFSINTDTGSFGFFGDIDEELRAIGKKFKLPFSLMRSQIIVYIKYNKWGFETLFPEKFLEPALQTPINYDIVNSPIALIDKNGKVVKYSEKVSLVTYARLSVKEEKEALKLLKYFQKEYLNPDYTKQVRRSRNIKRDIAIEKEMSTRIPSHKEEKTYGYLSLVKKEMEKGVITPEKFKEIKKNNLRDLEIVDVGKTSADVADSLLGDSGSAGNARQINSRIKKKKKKIFGNNM
ncbi:MAG: hypothetical protein NTY12_05505 [Candidatus Falkowbacteria bacterium]|nr:hypothetical protein [Candidatus Falkowbacteria bacterium]